MILELFFSTLCIFDMSALLEEPHEYVICLLFHSWNFQFCLIVVFSCKLFLMVDFLGPVVLLSWKLDIIQTNENGLKNRI